MEGCSSKTPRSPAWTAATIKVATTASSPTAMRILPIRGRGVTRVHTQAEKKTIAPPTTSPAPWLTGLSWARSHPIVANPRTMKTTPTTVALLIR